eukprot:scaffold7396_cov387-Prasinococcus_capsulatus_cf.AAC.3
MPGILCASQLRPLDTCCGAASRGIPLLSPFRPPSAAEADEASATVRLLRMPLSLLWWAACRLHCKLRWGEPTREVPRLLQALELPVRKPPHALRGPVDSPLAAGAATPTP